MSLWIPVTVENLNNAKAASLVDALRTSALAEDQTDRAPEIIQNAVNRLRDEIKGCRTNVLDADPTHIPQALLGLAVRLILWDLKNVLEYELTEGEKIDHQADLVYLQRIARGEVPIDAPDEAQVAPLVQPAVGTPLIGSRSRPCSGGLR